MMPLHIIAMALAFVAAVVVICQTFGARRMPDAALIVIVALIASCSVAGGST